MKASTILTVLLSALFIGCNSSKETGITGTYVNQGQSEYSLAYDTLIVTSIVKDKVYKIEQRTGFKRIKNKEPQQKEFKRQAWQANWDPNTRVLSETELGRQLFLKQDNKTLLIKNAEFIKVK